MLHAAPDAVRNAARGAPPPPPFPSPSGRGVSQSDVLAELLDAADRGVLRRAEAPAPPLPARPVDTRLPVSYAALLERNGNEFVRHAYAELLGREPDPGALAHYGDGLRGGRMTKAAILGAIRYSSEGRTIGKIVPGLRRRYLLQRSYGLPLLGRLLRIARSVMALPRVMRDLQRLEQMADADRARLDRLERALAASGPQLGVRVALAEVRLADLGPVEERLSALERGAGLERGAPGRRASAKLPS